MRRMIMWNLMTLDGFFDGPESWSLDWHQTVLDEAFHNFALEQLRSADMLVFGRVTYEGMAAYWQTAKGEIAEFMNSLPKLVCSWTLDRADWNNTTLIKGDIAAQIRELKQQGDGNMFVFGSADLSRTLMEERLFDEYRIAVVPIVLGSGKPLFGRGTERLRLKLLDTRTLPSGCVILRYEPWLERE